MIIKNPELIKTIKEFYRIDEQFEKEYKQWKENLQKPQESQATKYLFFGFLILVAVGFIAGNIYLSTL